MSGSIFTQTPIGNGQLNLAQKQARLLSCPDDTSANIVKCLKTKSAVELANTLPDFAVGYMFFFVLFGLLCDCFKGIWYRSCFDLDACH